MSSHFILQNHFHCALFMHYSSMVPKENNLKIMCQFTFHLVAYISSTIMSLKTTPR